MIVGKGLIASLFMQENHEDILIFASGVSNSSETRAEEFLREKNLLERTIANNPDKLCVYFSTCSIYDSSKNNSPYVLHKLKMEEFVKENASKYLILRVSNAVGKGGNPNLLMNYLIRSVENNETINVHTKATRNLIDAEDIKKITLELIDKKSYNTIYNLAYPQNYSIIELLGIIKRFYDIQLSLNLIKMGSGYQINIQETENYFIQNNLTNKEEYLFSILKKYYSN